MYRDFYFHSSLPFCFFEVMSQNIARISIGFELILLFRKLSNEHNNWVLKKQHKHKSRNIRHEIETYRINDDRVEIQVKRRFTRHRD